MFYLSTALARNCIRNTACLLALTGCAVNIRYSVPSLELKGREVLGRDVIVLQDQDDEPQPVHVIAVEFPASGRQILPTDENAEADIQSELAPDVEAELISDDVLTWPSGVGASGAAVGMATGVAISDFLFFIAAFGAGDSANGSHQTLDQFERNTLILAVILGATGALIGARIGARIADKPRLRHLAAARAPGVLPVLPLSPVSTPSAL